METEILKKMEVQIHEFQNSYAADFARLNHEWLNTYFRVEDYDKSLLEKPYENIVKPGGQILFSLIDGKVVGTTALIIRGDDTFELAKMAVSPKFQGLRIGQKLMYAAIDYSRRSGKLRIILDSNTKLEPAINLYKKVGFREIPYDPNTPYERCNIRMELML